MMMMMTMVKRPTLIVDLLTPALDSRRESSFDNNHVFRRSHTNILEFHFENKRFNSSTK